MNVDTVNAATRLRRREPGNRRTLRHLLRASERQRQMIAYDIHDGLAQQLAGAILQMQTYQHDLGNDPANAAKAFEAGMSMLREGYHEARRLIQGIRLPVLDEVGIVTAIAQLIQEPINNDGPTVEFRSRVHATRLPPLLETAVYRIVQEGLTNIRKHSGSLRARVSLTQHGASLQIRIRDWGVGFDRRKVARDRFGLEGIRERARLLGGECTIRSKPGRGTVVLVNLPVAVEDEDT